jgi:16S rRNA (cytidine1402-2'-O)-methyltransferase
MKSPVQPVSAGLHLISTPIGNAADITLRALALLRSLPVLAAEDTRALRHLMQIHGVALGDRPLIALHDHSGTAVIDRLVARMQAGEAVGYLSEAGTPLISDPGFALARAARAAGLPVVAAPGASAVMAGLVVSGMPAERFLFLGFLPAAAGPRRAALAEVAGLPFTLVIYEAPHRVQEMLGDLADILGEGREGAICRELTKRFEEVRRGTLADLRDGAAAQPVRGEIVIVVGPPQARPANRDDDIRDALRAALRDMRVKDAAQTVAGAFGLPQRMVYQMALDLRGTDE